jgi:hypothetical protein
MKGSIKRRKRTWADTQSSTKHHYRNRKRQFTLEAWIKQREEDGLPINPAIQALQRLYRKREKKKK